MTFRLRSLPLRKRALPGALVFVACGSTSVMDAGHDAGTDAGRDAGIDAGFDAGLDGGPDAGPIDCPGPDRFNDAGMKCGCEANFAPDGGYEWFLCCDPDIGTPCPACCYNPRDADGGRMYYPDSGTPVCFC